MLCLELLGSMAAIHRALDNPFLGDLYEEAIGTTGMYLFIILFAYDCLCLLLRSWTNWQRTWQTSRLGCQHCVQLMDNADPKIVSGNCSQAKVMEIQAKRRREWRTCANLVPAVSIYALGYTQIPLKNIHTYIIWKYIHEIFMGPLNEHAMYIWCWYMFKTKWMHAYLYGILWYCMAWYCRVVWCDVMWCDVTWCDVMWCNVWMCVCWYVGMLACWYVGIVWFVWYGTGRVRRGRVWSGLVWSGLVWSGLVWSGLVWSGLVRMYVCKYGIYAM